MAENQLDKAFVQYAKLHVGEDLDDIQAILEEIPEDVVTRAVEILNKGRDPEAVYDAILELVPGEDTDEDEADDGETEDGGEGALVDRPWLAKLFAKLDGDDKVKQLLGMEADHTTVLWIQNLDEPTARQVFEETARLDGPRLYQGLVRAKTILAPNASAVSQQTETEAPTEVAEVRRETLLTRLSSLPRRAYAVIAIAALVVIGLVVGGAFALYSRPTEKSMEVEAPIVEGPIVETFQPAPVISLSTPIPQGAVPDSQLAAGCPGGYVTIERFPGRNLVGQRVWKNLNFLEEPVSPTIEDKLYRVTPLMGREDVSVVQMSDGAYFAPSHWFPSRVGEVQECAPLASVPAFTNAFERLEPEVGAPTTVFDKDWWAIAAWGFALLLAGGALAEMAVKKQFRNVIWTGATVLVAALLSSKTTQEGQWLVYTLGLLAMLALGERGALAEVAAAIERTGQVQLPKEVKALFEKGEGLRQVVTAIDWSRPAVWAAINLFWGVLSAKGSPLQQQFGPLVATGLLGVQCLLFYGLEAWRRNRTGDWGSIAVGLLGGVVTAALAYLLPHGATSQTIALMATALLGVVIIVLVGVSGQQAIERDRIPDGLAAFGSLALTGLILVVRLFPG